MLQSQVVEVQVLTSLRILIVDDQPRTRQSLKALLATRFPQADTLEAANGAEALQRAKELAPDIILMDVVMPGMDGLQCSRLIKAIAPRSKIIVLSMYAEYQASALAAGADAFIRKGEPPEKLLHALTEIARE